MVTMQTVVDIVEILNESKSGQSFWAVLIFGGHSASGSPRTIAQSN